VAGLLQVLLRTASAAVIGMVAWIGWVVAVVLPSRDPGSIGTWSAIAVGSACLAAVALVATRRDGNERTLRVALGVLSGIALLFGAFVITTLVEPAGGHFEGYLLLVGSILALEGALGLGWLVAVLRR